jgi:hypothetical protein
MPNFYHLAEKLRATGLDKLSEQHGTTARKVVFAADKLTELEALSKELLRLWTPPADRPMIEANVKNVKDFDQASDSFIFNLYSALDSFALEVDISYGEPIDPKRVYIKNFAEKMHRKGYNSELIKHFEDLVSKDWFKYFNKLRNRITHHTPLVYGVWVYPSSKDTVIYLPEQPEQWDSPASPQKPIIPEFNSFLENRCHFLDTSAVLLQNKLEEDKKL